MVTRTSTHNDLQRLQAAAINFGKAIKEAADPKRN